MAKDKNDDTKKDLKDITDGGVEMIHAINDIVDEQKEIVARDIALAKSNAEALRRSKNSNTRSSRLDPYYEEILKRLKSGVSISILAEQCDISRKGLYDFFAMRGIDWKTEVEQAKVKMIRNKISRSS